MKIEFNDMLGLNDPSEDKNLNMWIRVTSKTNEEKFYSLLKLIIGGIKEKNKFKDTQLAKYFSDKLGVNVNASTVYGWGGGYFKNKRRGVPFKVIDTLLGEQPNLVKNISKADILGVIDEVTIRSGQNVKLVKEITPSLAYIIGIIIGDGSCSGAFTDARRKYREFKIRISKDRKDFTDKISEIIEDIFAIKCKSFRNNGDDSVWNIQIKSKYVSRLLHNYFLIPMGSKALTVKIPPQFYNASDNIKSALIRGLIDSDGCIYINNKKSKRRNCTYTYRKLKILFRVRSKDLVDGTALLLTSLGYKPHVFEYMGITFNRDKKV